MLHSDLCASENCTPLYTIQPVLKEINQQLGAGVGSMMTFVIPFGVKKSHLLPIDARWGVDTPVRPSQEPRALYVLTLYRSMDF
jgi:hypothetical protein